MSAPTDNEPTIAQVAAEWVSRCDRGLTATERERLACWREADPRHEAEFIRLGGTWRKLDQLGASEELSTLADDFVARARARRTKRRRLHWASSALAAAAAVAIGFAGWSRFVSERTPPSLQFPTENYRVLASTLERMTLPDGSIVELNGASRVEVDYTPSERRVRLMEGEAHFIVAKNPERPFFVTAGTLTVRAVGTAFNVRLAAESIEVLVTEGKVKLESRERKTAARASQPAPESAAESDSETAPALTQGQRAVVSRVAAEPAASVSIDVVNQAEIDAALGWQSTRLVFNNTPLHEVVEGFNRYNRHRLTLGNPKLRDRALTGVFRADNLEGFVRLLRASVDVKAEERTPHETVLLPIR